MSANSTSPPTPQVSGADLLVQCLVRHGVEVVFAYPGVGNLLYQAVRTFDYFVIYGVVFIVIVAIGLATLVLDLMLPVLDPRINY